MKISLSVLFFLLLTFSMFIGVAVVLSCIFQSTMYIIVTNDIYICLQLSIGLPIYGFMAAELAEFYSLKIIKS